MNRVNRLIAIVLSGIILFNVITTLSITANAASYFNGAYGDDFLSTESNSPMLKVTGSEFSNSETLAIDSLIDEGYSIKNDSDANAFTWIVKVLKFIEKYPDSFVYSDIKRVANDAKNYSSISAVNCKNKVLGYLSILKDEITEINQSKNVVFGDINGDGEITIIDATDIQRYLIKTPTTDNYKEILSIDNLISEGYSISDNSSANAFTWIVKVLKFIEKYPNSVVYSDIKSEANTAKNYSSISAVNCKNKVLGYLSILKDEIIESHPKINTIQGDIDMDGEITVVDSTFMQRYLIGVQTPYPIGKVIE